MNDFEFRFKKFGLNHSSSSMKVGTDSILLGALVESKQAKSILEIGTGCGIISLMLAQRFDAKITTVEIDNNSAQQSKNNFETSPWNDQIKLIEADIRFVNFCKKFDLIVSNPPYFQNDLLPETIEKIKARHAKSLNFKELLEISEKLLNKNGCLWLVLPKKSFEIFETESCSFNFHCELKTFIKNSPQQEISLIVSKWVKHETKLNVQNLVLRNEDGTFTEDYCSLTKDFHPFL